MELDLLTTTDLERMFGVTRQTLARWRKDKGLSWTRIGGKVFYQRWQVLQFLQNSQIKAANN